MADYLYRGFMASKLDVNFFCDLARGMVANFADSAWFQKCLRGFAVTVARAWSTQLSGRSGCLEADRCA